MSKAIALAGTIATFVLLNAPNALAQRDFELNLRASHGGALVLTSDQPKREIEFPVDRADGMTVTVRAGSKTAEVDLVDPSGAIVAADAYYSREDAPGRSSYFFVEKPAVGRWKMQAGESASFAGPVAVLFTVELDSDLAVGFAGLPSSLPAGAPVAVALVVADSQGGWGPSTGIVIDAAANLAGQPPVPLAFRDDGIDDDAKAGDGVWVATFTPSGAGPHLIRAEITGKREGAAFKRTVFESFEGVNSCGTLGPAAQSRSFDSDGDGVEDTLELVFQVDVKASGRFEVAARLAGPGGISVAAVERADLGAGAGAIAMRIPASHVSSLGAGAYRIAQAVLSCVDPATGESRASDGKLDLGVTGSFNPAGATVADPIVASGANSDKAVDSDANSRFDQLEVTVGVQVAEGGAHRWQARLYDSAGAEIDSVSESGSLNPGAARLVFRFSGLKIGKNGKDGPYEVRYFEVSGPGGGLYLDLVHVTKAYRSTGFEGPSDLQVSPVRLDFGPVTIGQSKELTVTVRNTGTQAFRVESVGVEDSAFRVSSPALPFTIAAGASQAIAVRFTPAAAGDQTGALIVGGIRCLLSGTGATASAASISISPLTLSFGTVAIGQTGDATLAVENKGSAPLAVSSIVASDPQFTLVSPTLPFSVAPAASQVVKVRFGPSAAGAFAATLTITSNAPSIAVPLTGTGAAAPAGRPAIGITPSSLDFGSVPVGQAKDLTATIANTGNGALHVKMVLSPNAMFRVVAPAPPFTVAPGASVTATIRFAPTAAGSQLDDILFGSDDPANSAAALHVRGTSVSSTGGAPEVALSATSLDYGMVTVGQSKDLTVIVRNSGAAPLVVASVLSGDPQFELVPPVSQFTLAPAGIQSLSIRFKPAAAGRMSASVWIVSNALNQPRAAMAVTGVGEALPNPNALIDVNPVRLDFSNIVIGQSREMLLVISGSRGSAPVTVSSVASDNPAVTVVSPQPPFTMGTGPSTNLVIRMTPATEGLVSATLLLVSDAGNASRLSVPVRGLGIKSGQQAAELKNDDGSFEQNIGYAAGGGDGYFASRLTPTAYPATIRSVKIYFHNTGNGLKVGSSIRVLVGAVSGGGDQLPAPTFQITPGQVKATGEFVEFAVAPVTIQSGDFLVGFVTDNPQGVYPLAQDLNGSPAKRSYISRTGQTFVLIDTVDNPRNSGNFGIRAVVASGP